MPKWLAVTGLIIFYMMSLAMGSPSPILFWMGWWLIDTRAGRER